MKAKLKLKKLLPPDLHNLYSSMILREQNLPGLTVGWLNLNNIRYKDNTVLMADSEIKLQWLLYKVIKKASRKD